MRDNKLVITKTFHFDLPKDAGSNMVNETDSIIKHNEHTIENEFRQLLSKQKQGNDIHEHRKQKNEWTAKICT